MNPSRLSRRVLVDQLVSELTLGRIRSVVFVVPSDVSMTLPLYDVAIATARLGWRIGLEDVRYWFVTPEPEPVTAAASQRLEPEGIAFIGSTYSDVRHGLVLLDPQGESIEADLVVSLGHGGGFDVTSNRRRLLTAREVSVSRGRVVSSHEPCTNSRPPEPVRPAAVAA